MLWWVMQMLGGVDVKSPFPQRALPQLLATAKANLRKTVFFGISDYWNTTLCLFHKELNGPGPRPSEMVNVRPTGSKAHASVTKEDTHLLRASVKFDELLYDDALQDFANRAAAYNCPMEL
jgi:hypothetical protein